MFLRILLLVYALLVLTIPSIGAASAPDLEDRTREIATELRCVVCQNLSVADSPSEMAQQMRAIVRDQLQAGKTPEQIKEFFVSRYGEWVLLKPKTTGFSVILWILPYAALLLGLLAALGFIWRWTKLKKTRRDQATQSSVEIQNDFLTMEFAQPDIEDSSIRAQLLRERGRLKDELSDLKFDFQSGKLSDGDYYTLKREIETRGAIVMQQLDGLPAEPIANTNTPDQKLSGTTGAKTVSNENRLKRWQLVAGSLFLMLFGLALGVLLTQSIRPRTSENDTMTGDFMTGTTPSSGNARAALDEGKQAFARQDFPKAIEAFKKALAADPNNAEAHAYMGFILVRAGHGDGALMAFDKALSTAPNFPMALWGRGMVLYQEKKDYAGAREIFERLLTIVPAGEERNEITKVLAEIRAGASEKKQAAASAQISGKITIDPKVRTSIDPTSALFIIARPAGAAGGPPLAVKKIDTPVFPLSYSLGQENVMMQGTAFAGKINITARLDKDNNPTTRDPGDLTGDFKNNPVVVGAENVDIVLNQVSP